MEVLKSSLSRKRIALIILGIIAILGGIDMNYLCATEPDEITKRSEAMLERSVERGGYALGSGNSIPDWVPEESFFAMIRAAGRTEAVPA